MEQPDVKGRIVIQAVVCTAIDIDDVCTAFCPDTFGTMALPASQTMVTMGPEEYPSQSTAGNQLNPCASRALLKGEGKE